MLMQVIIFCLFDKIFEIDNISYRDLLTQSIDFDFFRNLVSKL